MTDIFDTKIHCKKDGSEMKQTIINKNGFELRAVKCPKCSDVIIHPADLNASENFNDIKDKKFNVKLRMVGNSHAISIPKEIIDFMNSRQREMHREMDDIVRLWFDDFDTLKVSFFDELREMDEQRNNQKNLNNSNSKNHSSGINNLHNIHNNSLQKSGNYEKVLDDGRHIKRKVINDGKGNIEVLEEQSLNSPERSFKSVRIKKIRSFGNGR